MLQKLDSMLEPVAVKVEQKPPVRQSEQGTAPGGEQLPMAPSGKRVVRDTLLLRFPQVCAWPQIDTPKLAKGRPCSRVAWLLPTMQQSLGRFAAMLASSPPGEVTCLKEHTCTSCRPLWLSR